ncbi:MAG: leucyl/phenylalanyl-tRNA--protein transferase [marine bacterium B5-7]|nr:MAG: leucyl/phenylalanyl-tRNA--protein transferase [marine bacterium B5-7]
MRQSQTHPGDFPPLSHATPEGLLAIGGDLSADRLIEAYSRGIFPWFNPGQPILWWSPDPRSVLYPDGIRIHRSLRKTLRNGGFNFSMDHAFDAVIRECAARRRNDIRDSWITPDMIDAYTELYNLRIAHSIEVWQDDHLVGGLYGIFLGRVFFGESMFSRAPNASKCALSILASMMNARGDSLIDCQIESPHLESLGARSIPRHEFIATLNSGLETPLSCDRWAFNSGDLERLL